MRSLRSLASLAVLTVTALLPACSVAPDDDEAHSASEALGTWRDQTISANNLLDGEVALTFDDGPAASTVQVANLLSARGHVGLFFVVSKHLGSFDGRSSRLDPNGSERLGELVDAGQLVGNHTHDHCIGGAAACGGRSFADLGADDQRRQVEATDALVRATLASLGAPDTVYLPFFRSPGNSWSARTATNLASASVSPRSYGPIAWDVPARGEEDFRCWSANMSAAECAARYVRAFEALPAGRQRAVVLIHDNFPRAAELTRAFLDAMARDPRTGSSPRRTKAGNQVRIVHPRCIVGCTR
jgi:peptidoglycan/xylan/chitin deacetylase (PgdA/CDA1 family)